MIGRTPPFEEQNRKSARVKGDRVNRRPLTLRGLLRWAQVEYSMEPPPRLHDRDIADDGAPDFTGEAKSYFGFSRSRGKETEPDDWKEIACRLDDEGSYQTPLRCALERVPGSERRKLLRAVLPNVLFPSDAARASDIPDWCADDVLFRALTLLWDQYRDRPLPRRHKSDAQLDAEAA